MEVSCNCQLLLILSACYKRDAVAHIASRYTARDFTRLCYPLDGPYKWPNAGDIQGAQKRIVPVQSYLQP